MILVLGILLGIIRDPVGRIALIVFVTAVGEVVSWNHGRDGAVPDDRRHRHGPRAIRATQAVAATTLVLIFATAVMSSGCSSGPGWCRPSCPERANRQEASARCHRSRSIPLSRQESYDDCELRSRDISSPVAPREARAQDLGADRALVPEAAGHADRVGR